MKVQCSCGVKSVFEITPEMRSNPVRFVCPACGVDASEFVDGLIRQELGKSATPGGHVVTIQPTPATPAPAPVAHASSPPLRVRLDTRAAPVSEPARFPTEPAGPESQDPVPPRCPKHPSEPALEKCRVCSKPICSKCMELFGYLCSPLCRAKADSHGIQVPIYQGQKSLIEARRWRAMVWGASVAGALGVALLGFWIWHDWIGVTPKQVFSIRFPEPAYSGQSAFVHDQIVFLHGGTLARHDIKQNKQIWSRSLISKEQIQAEIARETQQAKALISKANNEAWENMPKMPDPEKLARNLEREEAAALDLRLRGQNIWILSSEKLVRYDWDTGKPVQEITIPPGYGSLIPRGDELLLMNAEQGRPQVTSINLTTCDSRTTEMPGTESSSNSVPQKSPGRPGATGRPADKSAGLPTGMPGRDAGKTIDPAKVAAQAQHMSLPERIALPAVLANSWSQERALAELNDDQRPKAQAPSALARFERVTLIPTRNGFLEFSSRLVERKMVARAAMKAPPAKSALDGPVSIAQSAEAANEILNDMQRSRGGDVVEEDLSRYAVTLRRAGTTESWTGEVIGQPRLITLRTVNVVAGNKSIVVLDLANKQMWQSSLNYNLPEEFLAFDELNAPYGQGPCVEREGVLYVFDRGVLAAFDLKSGNARWRVPSVGITGLFFDDKGMLYVNTTTGSPESIKFSRQIDINRKTVSVVLKINPADGKILWASQTGGLVNYVSGKFIYTVQSYAPEEEEENPYKQETGFETLPHLRIKRINPRNGHEMWEHFQQRAPLDVRFDTNTIRLVFKKEVQMLKTLAW